MDGSGWRPGGGLVGVSRRRWNGREPWLAQPGPHFLGRNGGKNPRGKRFFPLDSLLWWGGVGGGCTSHLLPGLRPSHWKARSGPPTGWAGWGRGAVPFGRRQKVTVWFPAFSYRQQTTSPARPSWWAGHEALVLEAAGQVRRFKTHAASTTVQRKGVWGKETLSPAGSRGTAPGALSPISPEKWGPAREGTVSACSNGDGKRHIPPSAAPRQPRQARPQKASRIWYHTAPPCTEADTPSLTNPNLA